MKLFYEKHIFFCTNLRKDKEKIFDRYLQQKRLLGKRGEIIDKKIGKKIKLLWEKS